MRLLLILDLFVRGRSIMSRMKFPPMPADIVASVPAGCASYPTGSNMATESVPPVASSTNVLIPWDIPDRKYRELGPVEASVRKSTVFTKTRPKSRSMQPSVKRPWQSARMQS